MTKARPAALGFLLAFATSYAITLVGTANAVSYPTATTPALSCRPATGDEDWTKLHFFSDGSWVGNSTTAALKVYCPVPDTSAVPKSSIITLDLQVNDYATQTGHDFFASACSRSAGGTVGLCGPPGQSTTGNDMFFISDFYYWRNTYAGNGNFPYVAVTFPVWEGGGRGGTLFGIRFQSQI